LGIALRSKNTAEPLLVVKVKKPLFDRLKKERVTRLGLLCRSVFMDP